jgi:hypothetical protein
MTVTRQRAPIRLRNRLAWTVVLVLIALGGAGLVSAADRPATDAGRPELSAHADAIARSWLVSMAAQARVVADDVDAVNESGRTILGLDPSAGPDQLDAAVAAGDQASADLGPQLASLVGLRAATPSGLDPLRMGQANRVLLAAIDGVAGGAQPVSGKWQALSADTTQVTALLVALTSHDAIDSRATAAGGRGDWPDALDLLAQAGDRLTLARGARDQLAASNAVDSLDQLLDGYADYDAALVALYTAVRDGAGQDSEQARELAAAVVAARNKLPADGEALAQFVFDFAGATIASEVVDLETARGTVDAAADNLP